MLPRDGGRTIPATATPSAGHRSRSVKRYVRPPDGRRQRGRPVEDSRGLRDHRHHSTTKANGNSCDPANPDDILHPDSLSDLNRLSEGDHIGNTDQHSDTNRVNNTDRLPDTNQHSDTNHIGHTGRLFDTDRYFDPNRIGNSD